MLAPPARSHVIAAKLVGATMWCWILWRFKHDWKEVFVRVWDKNTLTVIPPPLTWEGGGGGAFPNVCGGH